METNVQPKGQLQKKMVKTIQGLVQQGFTLEEIYEAVCTIYPLMRDNDVCFLDLYLHNEFGRHHSGLIKRGDILIGGLRVCLGPHDRHFFKDKPKNVRYNSLTRTHFAGDDAFSSGASYMAAAVKVVNLRYGKADTIVDLKVDVDAKDKCNPVKSSNSFFEIAKDEYSKIVYIPLSFLSDLMWISVVENNLQFWIKVYTEGCNEAAECIECFLAGELDNILPVTQLAYGTNMFEKDWKSTVGLGHGYNVQIEMYLRLWLHSDWTDRMSVTVEVKEDNASKPDPIYRKRLDIPHYEGNVFHYKGQLFEDLVKYNLNIFSPGSDYTVSFWYMGREMFWIALYCFGGQLLCKDYKNVFQEAEELGEMWRGEKWNKECDMEEDILVNSLSLLNVEEGKSLSDAEEMTGFALDKLDTFYVIFGLVLSNFQSDNEYIEFKVIITAPNGEEYEKIAVYNSKEEDVCFYFARYDKDDNIQWQKGRYGVRVIWWDKETDIIKVTFTVGDWDSPGTYDVKQIEREFGEESKEQEALAKQEDAESAASQLQELIGLDEVKTWVDDLRKQISLVKKRREMGLPAQMPVLHARFYGNSGTGKTTVANLLGKILKEEGILSKGHVVKAERKTLIAGRWYDSANKATMEAVDKAQGGILFIDEAYNLYNADDLKDPGKDIIDSLLTALSDETLTDWMLILAGYPQQMANMVNSNPGFESRLPNLVVFKDYDVPQLMQIAKQYCQKNEYALSPEAERQIEILFTRDYANRRGSFGNARYVVNLFRNDILQRMGKRLSGIENPTREELVTLLPADIPTEGVVKVSSKLNKLREMVGLTELKESIQEHLNFVKMCNNRLAAGLNTQMPPLHMVFVGNPGTGKTTVADFIGEIYASMGILSEGNVIKVTRKDLVGQFVGHAERNMREIFNRARGNVLFIDEAYELNPHGNTSDPGKAVLDALVDELDGDRADFIVVLAGYQKDMEELLETNDGLKSRFPNIFHFKDYSVEELVKIALESKVAKDFDFTPEAVSRLEAYIRREVLQKQKGFGNGRFVTRLISGKILPNMATRLSGIENPTVDELKTILAEDIPITAEEAQAVNETGFDEKLINDSLAKLDAMVGLVKVKKAIHNFVEVACYRNSIGEKFVGGDVLKWSFAGNTGTGKSTVAKIFANILKGMNLLAKGNFVEVKGEQIYNVTEFACDQVLKSAVERSRYGMLFIDGDAPEFMQRSGFALTNEQLKIKLTQLTAENGGAGAIVVAECVAKRQNLVASMASNGIYEFDHTFIFDDYTPDELLQILSVCLASHKVHFTPEAASWLKKYIADMAADKHSGTSVANARTMKLLSRTIYEIVMLRESRNAALGAPIAPAFPRRTVCLCDVERFVWKSEKKRVGYSINHLNPT